MSAHDAGNSSGCDPRRNPARDQRIAELARLLPAPSPRDLPAGRQQILKEHLMSEMRSASRPASRRSRRYQPGRGPLIAGAAAVAAVAAATTLVVSSLGGPVPARPGGPRPAAALTAAQLLDKVATAAARQPALVVRGREWEYTKTVIREGSTRPGVPLGRPFERQAWESPRGTCYPPLVEDPAQGIKHQVGDDDAHGPCHVKPGFYSPTWKWLLSLPTSPRALLRVLRASTSGWSGQAQDGQMFDAIGSLFQNSMVPPRLSAGLFRAAALIPGVSVDQNAADAIGRHGIAVALVPGARSLANEEWIFSRTRLQWLGTRNVLLKNGQVTLVTAVVHRAIVQHRGQLPPGH